MCSVESSTPRASPLRMEFEWYSSSRWWLSRYATSSVLALACCGVWGGDHANGRSKNTEITQVNTLHHEAQWALS